VSKHIRPLAAFKKANPKLYNGLNFGNEGHSKKAQENEFYWTYAYVNLNDFSKDLETRDPAPFFWKDENNKNNKLTITELGRLLLTGWYYDIEDYTKELSLYILKAYEKKTKDAKGFNDMEFYKVVKQLRENIGYYYYHKDEAKYYLLESIFNNELKTLLPPPPQKIEDYERTLAFISEVRKNQKKKGINHWIENAENWESYSYYLIEFLESLGVEDFLSFEDWIKEQEREGKEYYNELRESQKEYKKQIFNYITNLKLLE
jgi:hypothetical protein